MFSETDTGKKWNVKCAAQEQEVRHWHHRILIDGSSMANVIKVPRMAA